MDHIEVYDNGGETADRYSVRIGTSVYGMSDNATSANGFNQYAGELSELPGWRNGTRVDDLRRLPVAVRAAIFDRYISNDYTARI